MKARGIRMKRLIMILFLVLLAAISAGSALSEEVGAGKEHPCIHIVTEEGQPVLSRETYVPATVTVLPSASVMVPAQYRSVSVESAVTVHADVSSMYRLQVPLPSPPE